MNTLKTNYRATIAHGILINCKAIAEATGIPSNDLVRTCLTQHEVDGKKVLGTKMDQATYEKYAVLLEKEINDITGVYSKLLHNRPKPDRISGRCYMNAYDEWKQTGNEPVIGFEAKFAGRFVSIVPHAFNIDKKGNCYDTANDYKCARIRPCWVRVSGKEAKDWLTVFAKHWKTGDMTLLKTIPVWTDVWGGLAVIVHSDNKAYLTRTFGLTDEHCDKECKYYKTLDYSTADSK